MGLKHLEHKPRQKTVRVVLDSNLVEELDQAKRRLANQQAADKAADATLGSPAAELAAAVAAAEAAVDEAAVSFTFQALPRHELATLVTESPPTPEELDMWGLEAEKNIILASDPPKWSLASFPPKVIAASLIHPEAEPGEVQELWETGGWSEAIWNTLWRAAWSVNQEASTRPT